MPLHFCAASINAWCAAIAARTARRLRVGLNGVRFSPRRHAQGVALLLGPRARAPRPDLMLRRDVFSLPEFSCRSGTGLYVMESHAEAVPSMSSRSSS